MTLDAVFLCRLLGHPPEMGLVTIFALHIHAKMKLMFANPRYIRVALHAIYGLRFHLAGRMRFMTFIAVELHGRVFVYLNFDRLLNGR